MMEAERTEGVVERAVNFVKDALGLPPARDTRSEAAPPESEEAASPPPVDDSAKGALELNAESARREDGE